MRILFLPSDGYLSSNVGHVILLIGAIDLNPDIDRDGKIDLSDAVMGLHALVGMNSYDVNLRDIVFGMKFISEWK